MPMKVILDFDADEDGWSETYWNNGTDPTAYLVVSPGLLANSPWSIQPCPANALMHRRRQILAPSSRISHIRVNLVNQPRNVRVFSPASVDGIGLYPRAARAQAPAPGAEIWTKLLMHAEAGVARERNFWLGGIPEQIISPDQEYAPTAQWNTALGNFISELRDGAYGVVSRNTALLPVPATAITSFVVAASGKSATVQPLVAPVPAVPSWYVTIRGMNAPGGWNGVHRASIDPTDPTKMIVGPGRTTHKSLPAWVAGPSGGSIQVLTYPFTGFDRIFPTRLAVRKVGRFFGATVGRRPRP